jgi:hypothetical protein
MDRLHFKVTFGDFEMLQRYMMRRTMAHNRRAYLVALAGVVVCALLLAMAIHINAAPVRSAMLLSNVIPYPISFYLLLIACLAAAIISLVPAILLRRGMLRMQVSDDGPLLGETEMFVEEDGLAVNRELVKSKYLWPAFKSVEIAKGSVVLPVDNGIGLVIPAEAFHSDAERYAFAAKIASRLHGERPAG